MAPQTLFIVASDPRVSARPAEAVRIAAGVAAWKKTTVRLYLHGPAILGIGEWVDTLIDEDNFIRYLPILRDMGLPVLVQDRAVELVDLGEPSVAFERISLPTLARLVAESRQTLRF